MDWSKWSGIELSRVDRSGVDSSRVGWSREEWIGGERSCEKWSRMERSDMGGWSRVERSGEQR